MLITKKTRVGILTLCFITIIFLTPQLYFVYKFYHERASYFIKHSILLFLHSNKKELRTNLHIYENYKTKFINELKKNNVKIPNHYDKIKIIYTNDAEPSTIASCDYFNLLITININQNGKTLFRTGNNIFTESLIYHELAHCLLGMEHSQVKNTLMYPILIYSIEQELLKRNRWISDSTVLDQSNEYNKSELPKHYLDKLFLKYLWMQKKNYKHPHEWHREHNNSLLYDLSSIDF